MKKVVLLTGVFACYLIAGVSAHANSHNQSNQPMPGRTPGLVKQPMKPPKKNNKVQYNHGVAYCNKPYQLYYSPSKDQYFCGLRQSAGGKFMLIRANGEPYCIKPYHVYWTNERTRLFPNGKKPKCTKAKKKIIKPSKTLN